MRNQNVFPAERVRVAVMSEVTPSNQQLNEGMFVLLVAAAALLATLSLSVG